jgi:hypothetical protein
LFTRYDTLKKIQNTVRVSSSQYTNELASLTSTPKIFPTWNNMSDRTLPHIQRAYNRTILSTYRPGALSPGGIGCDVKHNSYVRYLNRLKGRKVLRKEPIPATFILPNIPFNNANPIYGDKQVKTSVVNCPPCGPNQSQTNLEQESAPYYQPYTFSIGQNVAVKNPINLQWIYGIITNYTTNTELYTIETNTIIIQAKSSDMYINTPCPMSDP